MSIKFDQYGNVRTQNAKLPDGITRNHVRGAYNAKAKEGGLIGTFLTIEEAVSAQESFTGHAKNVTFNAHRGTWVVKRSNKIIGEFGTQKEAIIAQRALADSKNRVDTLIRSISHDYNAKYKLKY